MSIGTSSLVHNNNSNHYANQVSLDRLVSQKNNVFLGDDTLDFQSECGLPHIIILQGITRQYITVVVL